jgi:hypothetical protein
MLDSAVANASLRLAGQPRRLSPHDSVHIFPFISSVHIIPAM